MTDRTIIIAGSGRCGSSLVMQMLYAANVPCIGTYPDFESADTLALLQKEGGDFEDAVRGKAVKILDPHRFRLPQLENVRVVWLNRNPAEQAKSAIKFMQHSGVHVENDKRTRKMLSRSYREEQRRVPFLLRKHFGARAVGTIDFEVIIKEPESFARVLCEFVYLNYAHIPAMAKQVVARSPECLPYMLEPGLMDER